LTQPADNFVAHDAQQYPLEIPRDNDSYRMHEETHPKDLRLPDVAEARLTISGSGLTDELSYLHYAVHSKKEATSTIANFQQGFDNELWQLLLPPSVVSQIEDTHLPSDRFNDGTSVANQPLLQRWAYETSNANITFAERLEKTNWEGSRMERL
jgi:hypothetical protein